MAETARPKTRRNLQRFILRSKPFWMSLVLLALILVFTFLTFFRLSAYSGSLTGDYRQRQHDLADAAAAALTDFYGHLSRLAPFLGANADPRLIQESFREMPLMSDSRTILCVMRYRGDENRLETVHGEAPEALPGFIDAVAGEGRADTSFLVTRVADSLDRILLLARFQAGRDEVFFLTDANSVLKRFFEAAGDAKPMLYWILGREGRMVRFPVQFTQTPMHPISRKNFSNCSGCHPSDYDEKFSARSGTHVISYPPGKQSLIAWSKASVLGRDWTIVLTMPASDINRLLNDGLISTRHFVIFTVVMVVFFLVFNFVNLQRQVMLEAEKKVLQNDLAAAEKIRGMEATLEKAQRLEGLSVLAGGLAHEINNPITNIVLYSRLLRQRARDPGMISDIEVIERESKKVKFIVFDMLSYIQRTNTGDSPTSTDLNRLVGELLEINTAILKKRDLDIRCVPADGLPLLMADANRIMQVMVNLFNNAMDAVRDGGVITIRTGAEVSQAGVPCVFFVISDTGPGIPPDQLGKIFEPFFTTKPAGVGTGLGLPVSKAIVEKMGGRISVDSAAGQGTSVKVILPIR